MEEAAGADTEGLSVGRVSLGERGSVGVVVGCVSPFITTYNPPSTSLPPSSACLQPQDIARHSPLEFEAAHCQALSEAGKAPAGSQSTKSKTNRLPRPSTSTLSLFCMATRMCGCGGRKGGGMAGLRVSRMKTDTGKDTASASCRSEEHDCVRRTWCIEGRKAIVSGEGGKYRINCFTAAKIDIMCLCTD